MNRRFFFKSSLAALGSFSMLSGGSSQSFEEDLPMAVSHATRLAIQYARHSIPPLELPRCRGVRYQDSVPDTLDVAERAKLGINVLTSATDPEADYEIYIGADLVRNPPVMTHDFADWCQLVEGMMEGLPLLRNATGSSFNEHVDEVWMMALLKSLGADGLVYLPMNGRPWSRTSLAGLDPVWRADGTTTKTGDASVTQLTAPCMWARALGTMTAYYVRDDNPIWKDGMQRMIRRMSELTIIDGDRAFIPFGSFEPNAKLGVSARQMRPKGDGGVDVVVGRLMQGLAQYYNVSGYEPAAVLAGKLTNYLRHDSGYYDADGRFIPQVRDAADYARYMWDYIYAAHAGEGPVCTVEDLRRLLEDYKLGGHFHTHAIGLLSVLEYALAIHDREAIDWVKSGFEWAKTQGSSLVGFFPEQIMPHYPVCETCEVADMIAVALKLTKAGNGDYWDDIDRWVRNQFAENQLTDIRWVLAAAQAQPAQPIPAFSTGERVAERNVGAFTPRATGNQWGGIWHCCTGNGVRALYYVWEHILEEQQDGKLQVNLLLNRASASADLYSFIPYQGRVVLKMKKDCASVAVRAPEWVKNKDPRLKCEVNGSPHRLDWEGRYVSVGPGRRGQTISLTFPIQEQTVRETLGNVRYALVIKGSTVVSIDPPGKLGPLYNRAYYRSGEVHWRRVQRFLPESEIVW